MLIFSLEGGALQKVSLRYRLFGVRRPPPPIESSKTPAALWICTRSAGLQARSSIALEIQSAADMSYANGLT